MKKTFAHINNVWIKQLHSAVPCEQLVSPTPPKNQLLLRINSVQSWPRHSISGGPGRPSNEYPPRGKTWPRSGNLSDSGWWPAWWFSRYFICFWYGSFRSGISGREREDIYPNELLWEQDIFDRGTFLLKELLSSSDLLQFRIDKLTDFDVWIFKLTFFIGRHRPIECIIAYRGTSVGRNISETAKEVQNPAPWLDGCR